MRRKRRSAAKSSLEAAAQKEADSKADEEDEDDIGDAEDSNSDDSDYGPSLKFKDTYDNDEAWNKNKATPQALFTSVNPLAKLAVDDPTNKTARRQIAQASASGQAPSQQAEMATRVSAWASHLVLKSQDVLAELSAQQTVQVDKSAKATATVHAADEKTPQARSAALVTRAYAGKGANLTVPAPPPASRPSIPSLSIPTPAAKR